MRTGVLLASAAGVVGVYTACFHGWVYLQHRPAREHLWVALVGAAVAVLCFGGAMLSGQPTPQQAALGLQLQIAGAVGVTFGLLRFGVRRFGIDLPLLVRGADGLCIAIVLLDLLAPSWLMRLDRPPQIVQALAEPFHLYELTALSQALLLPFFVFHVVHVVFADRAVRRGEPGARPLLFALVVWLAAAVLDSLTVFGWTSLPVVLSAGGYPLLLMTVSGVLVYDLVRAMDEHERLGERLQSLAHARADELRAVDARLARGEQLAAIGTLAAGVAHEINNPLAYVNANLNHLQALWQEKQPDPREVEEVLAECREGLARVSAIAADLLRMARHGASEQRPVDLSEVVRSVLPMVERECEGRVRIETSLAPCAPVRGSARLLGQVVLNLVWNAIHAAGSTGDDSEPRVELTTRTSDGTAELCVADNGPGIPAELIEQIFDPADASRALGQGTGLGLALVRLIVQRHGGQLRAENDAFGARVRVLLPARPALGVAA
ncbi:MAG TPA: ATP-binding protein [Myxococcota bacterium]